MKLYRMIGIAVFLSLMTTGIYAKGVAAGTAIRNIAELTYQVNDTTFSTTSNTVTDIVDQVIELDIVCQEPAALIVQRGETRRALTLQLSNTGNGSDHYILIPDTNATATDVTNREIWLDDGDGVFNSTTDTKVSDINLSEDAKATLFLVSDIPADAHWQTTSQGIKAESTIVPSIHRGDVINLGNYWAINGFKGGIDKDYCTYALLDLSLKLQKTATLSSPRLYKGTKIHYKIVASVQGVGTVQNVVLSDSVPQGTVYVANSLQLDGTVLNKDSLYVSAGVILVPVGDMTQTDTVHPTHTLEFDVVVK